MLASRQEAFMTLTLLDPRTGQRVTLTIRDKPPVQQPQPAQVVTHPRFWRTRQDANL
jgi:hypothetical protein